MRAQFFDVVIHFKRGGEVITSVTRYKLLMNIKIDVSCWKTFNKIKRKTLLKGELPGFEALEQALKLDEASDHIVDHSAD